MKRGAAVVPELVPGNFCYWVDDEQDVTKNGGFVPSVVIENAPGHYPLSGKGVCASPWVWGTTAAAAQQVARDMNQRMAISLEREVQIIASSMRASMQGKRAVRS